MENYKYLPRMKVTDSVQNPSFLQHGFNNRKKIYCTDPLSHTKKGTLPAPGNRNFEAVFTVAVRHLALHTIES
jgi:hypothetical protein